MIVTTLTENLSKALTIASRFTGGKVQLPVLANILLKTDKNKVIISATNLETSISISVGAKVEKEGRITVPGKTFTDLICNLPNGQLTLEDEEEKVKVKSESFESVVLGVNASDYPNVPEKGNGKTYKISTTVLESVFKKILFSVSTDETRPILTGVLVILKKEEIVFVSTDGFRLSHKKVAVEGLDFEDEQRLIIPKNTLNEVLKVSAGNSAVEFSFNKEESQIIFLMGDSVLSSRIIQGDFPDFEKIIPKASEISVNVDKSDFVRAVKLASVFARESSNVVKLEFSKGAIDVSAESAKSGNQKTKIDANIEGNPDFAIAYNYRFLEDLLNVIDSESVDIKLTDSNIPGLFRDLTDKDYFHIIMPIKLAY